MNLSALPWYATVAIAIFSSLLTFFSARLTSKDKKESDLLAQTMQRQTQLDEVQAKMLDDFKSDYGRLRDELALVRQEQFEEKKKNNDLERKVDKLTEENAELRQENRRLNSLVENLTNQIEESKKEKESARE